MSHMRIDFDWQVHTAGYEIRDEPPIKGREALIVPRAGPKHTIAPLEIAPLLFVQFSELAGSPASCADFATKWGLLGLGVDVLPAPIEEEPVFVWQKHIKAMKKARDIWKNGTFVEKAKIFSSKKIANLALYIEPTTGNERFHILVKPPSLLSAIWLQFIHHVTQGKDIKACEWCGNWFEFGQGTRKRRDTKFCSNKCRASHHNHLKMRGG